MNKKILKDFALLVGIIVVCAIAARILAGGETLSDYAVKNPETAGIASTESADTGNISVAKSSAEDDASAKEISKSSDIASSAASSSSATSQETAASNDQKSDASALGSSADSKSSSASASSESSDSSSAVASQDVATTEISSEASNAASTTQEIPSAERVTYMDGFYYEPISNEVFKRISGISYPVDCTVPLDELRYLSLLYVDFNGNTQTGEMICNKALAQDIIEIFYELYTNSYQIESIRLIDEFDGDDTASMLANNTSCFNYRVVEGTTKLSNHAYGRAIDLNPFYNPYITYNKDGTTNISPEGSEAYADRAAAFPYKIDENDLAYKLFKEHGFKWGGNWNSCKDYQHFEKK